jgi:hypothetical protein
MLEIAASSIALNLAIYLKTNHEQVTYSFTVFHDHSVITNFCLTLGSVHPSYKRSYLQLCP